MSRQKRALVVVTEADSSARHTHYPLTIHRRGCVSASNDTWMQPVHPATDDGALTYVVQDGAA